MEAPDNLPTLVPPFRKLVEVFEECLETGSPLYCLAKELKETDAALGEMLARFDQEACYQDLTLDEEDAAADCYEAFQTLREELGRLRECLGSDDRDLARSSVGAAGDALRKLEDGFRRLRESERARPTLNPVPAVDALLRTGRAVVEERLPLEVLDGRLQPLLQAWEQAARGVALTRRTDPSAEGLAAPLEAHGQALGRLQAALEREDREDLPAALDAVDATARAVHEAGQAAAQAPPPEPGVLCARCGALVPLQLEACSACGARRPDAPWESPGSSPAADLPDYVGTLVEVSERLRQGEEAWAEFQEAVAEVRRRAEHSLSLLERVALPAAGTPPDEVETWQEAQTAVENGLERFFEGLEHLEALAGQPEEWVLDRGLEAVLAAVEETRQVGAAWQRLVESRTPPAM